MAGAASASTTLRPSFAASSAAATPEIPAPSTQISARTILRRCCRCLRTVLVGIGSDLWESNMHTSKCYFRLIQYNQWGQTRLILFIHSPLPSLFNLRLPELLITCRL